MSDRQQNSGAVSRLIEAVEAGEGEAAEHLLPVVYGELRSLAKVLMAKVPPGNSLQPTALVHEAFLRLVGKGDPGWNGRGHFFGAAAKAMRQILVDQARRKGAVKHGGDQQRVGSVEALNIESPSTDMIALDDALTKLEGEDPRAAQVVELRYIIGLTAEETASVLGISVSTVEREWRFARALLRAQLTED